jgi:haloalkane dehalogenase
MELRRTPDAAFADLAGYPFTPHYLEVADPDGGNPVRLHHLGEGDLAGPVVLLLHGEPTWSYLYRNVLPPLVADGCRVIAPDLIGFGRSDKPTRMQDHTYARHVDWLAQALFDQLDLREVVLFCQDWGGLIGLRLVAAHPHRFAGVVASNTGLPTGDETPSEAFLAWQRAAREMEEFPTGRIVDGGSLTALPQEVIAAYDAPFPDAEYQAGPRVLPSLVPTTPDDPAAADSRRAWQALRGYTAPFLTAFSDQDPITAGGQRPMQRLIPGADGQPHRTIAGAGHFVQEDAPEEVVAAIRAVLAATALRT